LEAAAGQAADTRKPSNATWYGIRDGLMGAFAVFYFLHPSFLNFQEEMKRKCKRSNLERLFGVKDVPCTEHIKNLVDDIEPESLEPAFTGALELARRERIIEKYRVLGGHVPVALDGTWYHASEKIHCKHCLTMTKKVKGEERTLYYHDVVAAAIVAPGNSVVLPLMPEMVRNEDAELHSGTEKQDCERNAAKRWFEGRGEALKWLKPVFLGDDLYACHDICAKIAGLGYSFIFTCREESHPWIAEQVANSYPQTHKKRKWNGRNHMEYRYSWVNGVENRADGEKMLVNWLSLEVWNEEAKKVTYHNTWITDKEVTKDTAAELAECGRARWKIENEHNNVLKHRGYNLKHNFGHGENHASEVFCLLNLLAFLFHGIQDNADEDYKKARASFGRRDAFFWALRYEMSRYLHDDWHDFFLTIAGEEAPDG